MELSFYDVANHPLIYTMVAIGITLIAGMALISVRKSWKRAKELGYESKQLKNIVKSSVTFSIVPSIAIVVGFFSLASMLGIPWPWWRLSVVGSVTYEIMAAEMALNSAQVQLESATGGDFILVMFVMTIGILGGIVLSTFFAEKIHSGSIKMQDKDQRWGSLGNSVFMMAIIIAFVIPMFFDGYVKVLTLITSMVVAFIFNYAAKKFQIKWLSNFTLVFTMIISMGSSLLWTKLFAA